MSAQSERDASDVAMDAEERWEDVIEEALLDSGANQSYLDQFQAVFILPYLFGRKPLTDLTYHNCSSLPFSFEVNKKMLNLCLHFSGGRYMYFSSGKIAHQRLRSGSAPLSL